ncbi:uncharacterized protein VTP21DRAFT_1638 [Calcarisporiella thermophila]|uniref:uncharacterized protein n=1 Tax=Calcarisporiella thermophila TaxID=911321 RepID=UPI003743E14A
MSRHAPCVAQPRSNNELVPEEIGKHDLPFPSCTLRESGRLQYRCTALTFLIPHSSMLENAELRQELVNLLLESSWSLKAEYEGLLQKLHACEKVRNSRLAELGLDSSMIQQQLLEHLRNADQWACSSDDFSDLDDEEKEESEEGEKEEEEEEEEEGGGERLGSLQRIDTPTFLIHEAPADGSQTPASIRRGRLIRRCSSDLRRIVSLEGENMTLKTELKAIQKDAQDKQLNYGKKLHLLESQLEWLQSCVEDATSKIEELESANARLTRTRGRMKRCNSHIMLLEQLAEKCTMLESANSTLLASKREIEHKLRITLEDLASLKEQHESLQLTRDDYEALKKAYESQTHLVRELEQQLEEYRQQIESLPPACRWTPPLSPFEEGDEAEGGEEGLGVEQMMEMEMFGEGSDGIDDPSDGGDRAKKHRRRSSGRKPLFFELEEQWMKSVRSADNSTTTKCGDEDESRDDMTLPMDLLESWLAPGLLFPPEKPAQDSAAPPEPRSIFAMIDGLFDRILDGTLDLACWLTWQRRYASAIKERVRNGLIGLVYRLAKRIFSLVLRWGLYVYLIAVAVMKEIWQGPVY